MIKLLDKIDLCVGIIGEMRVEGERLLNEEHAGKGLCIWGNSMCREQFAFQLRRKR